VPQVAAYGADRRRRCTLANEAVWWTWRFATEGNRFPDGMPLQLCDLSIWVTIVALF
jgi:uncharacterized membrane protein YwaF